MLSEISSEIMIFFSSVFVVNTSLVSPRIQAVYAGFFSLASFRVHPGVPSVVLSGITAKVSLAVTISCAILQPESF